MANTRYLECRICLSLLFEPVSLACGHVFCWPCVYHWSTTSSFCPVCMRKMTEYIPLYVDLPLDLDRVVDRCVPPRPDAVCAIKDRTNRRKSRMWSRRGLEVFVILLVIYIGFQLVYRKEKG